MKIIISNKEYSSWDQPTFNGHKKKPSKTKLKFFGRFESDEISDIVIIEGYKYTWVLKGCILLDNKIIRTGVFDPESNVVQSELTISYQERNGSHISQVVKSQIRDWSISKILQE